MATITKRSGKFQAQIRRNGESMSKTFRQKADAESWARKTESEIERGLYVSLNDAGRLTPGDLIDRYKADILPLKRSTEVMKYRLNHLREYAGNKKPVSITPALVSESTACFETRDQQKRLLSV
jgi:hypothetical protein